MLIQGCQEHEFNAELAWAELTQTLADDYAYLDRANFDLKAVQSQFNKRALNATSKQEFADISQAFLRHFNDPHLNLGPYNENDYIVFPTGSDIRAILSPNNASEFIVEDVKANSAADNAGILPGMVIESIEGESIEQAITHIYLRPFDELTDEQKVYGVNIALGGYRNQARTIQLSLNGEVKGYQLADTYSVINQYREKSPVSHKTVEGFAYIRFNNSLGNSDTPTAFKKALQQYEQSKGLIIDLRNTPSGGNTSVAEPILGHFVNQKQAYQLYRTQHKGLMYHKAELNHAYVKPNAPYYDKPFIVLAGRWTGSMGEGMTIGFDAIGANAIVGAPMADLLGGIKTKKLTFSDTWLEVAFERLYHVDGTFREDFEPNVLVVPADKSSQGNDPALDAALALLKSKIDN